MASIRKEIRIDAAPEKVWDAVRDIGNIHKRLVPGFVADCRMEGRFTPTCSLSRPRTRATSN